MLNTGGKFIQLRFCHGACWQLVLLLDIALLCITSTWPFDMVANEYRKSFTITKNSCVKCETSTKR